jgi:hypothetical protein
MVLPPELRYSVLWSLSARAHGIREHMYVRQLLEAPREADHFLDLFPV